MARQRFTVFDVASTCEDGQTTWVVRLRNSATGERYVLRLADTKGAVPSIYARGNGVELDERLLERE